MDAAQLCRLIKHPSFLLLFLLGGILSCASTITQAHTFVVQTTGDDFVDISENVGDGISTAATLRSAIEFANNESDFPGSDTIIFDEAVFNSTIELVNVGDTFTRFGLSSNSAFGIDSEIIIQGPENADITLTAGVNGNLRHFQVNEGGVLSVSKLTLDSGHAPDHSAGIGGAIVVGEGGGLSLDKSILSNNTANTGGAVNIRSNEISSITSSTFFGNSTTGDFGNGTGGAVFKTGSGALLILDSNFTENYANYNGGALYTSGNMQVMHSTIHGNHSRLPGGGIGTNNIGVLTMINSTVSDNTSESNGGGVSIATSPGEVEDISVIINSTIANNHSRAEENFEPQASVIQGDGPVFNSTGGGLSASRAENIELHNTLITGNVEFIEQIPDDIAAQPVPASSHNLFSVGGSVIGLNDGENGNQIGSLENPVDAGILPLADNGGPTQTHALLPGSAAIDGASDCVQDVTTDQRGRPRPGTGSPACDIGAFELQADEDFDTIFGDRFEQ